MKQKAHRLFLIILINSLIGINLIAQSNYYVLHGDTITQHKVLLQKPYMNAQWCPVYDTSEIVRYSPSEVSAYMTEKTLFVSAEIDLHGERKQVFLELLVEGSIRLYVYSTNLKTFYIAQKSGHSFVFLEDSKKEGVKTLREQINDIAGNDETAIYLRKINLNHNSLKSAFNRLNHPEKWYRHTVGLGLRGGVIRHSLTQSNVILDILKKEEFKFNPTYSFTSGLVFDLPVDPIRLVISPQYTYYSFLASTRNANADAVVGLFTDYNLYIETELLILPISLRYAWHAGNFAFYAGGGLHTSYQFQTKTTLRTSEVLNGPGFLAAFHTTKPIETRRKLHTGLLLEAGTAYKLTERYQLHLGLIYTYLLTQTKSIQSRFNHNTHQLQPSLSIIHIL